MSVRSGSKRHHLAIVRKDGMVTKMKELKTKVLINRKKLLAMIPLSDRTIFNMEQRGEFPRRIALTSRNVAWDLAEVEAWIDSRKCSNAQAMRPGSAPGIRSF